ARRRLPLALALLAAASAAAVAPAHAIAASAAPPGHTSVVLAFVPTGGAALGSVSALSVGIMSATEGRYASEQLLLDVSQGARIASSAYAHARPPPLTLRPVAGGAVVEGWAAARRRAERAPQLLRPGLLASSIPGGGAYAGITDADHTDGAVAADGEGRVAALSLGWPATLPARIAALARVKRLVVGDL